ncbi:MAG: CoA pyrophosphatase [Myxococcota bacterium]
MTPIDRLRLPSPLLWPETRLTVEAAVAVVLRGATIEEAEVLLVRRARRSGDPWSGDMALPGGRRDADDPHLLATAMRETREEVGLDLTDARMVGRLGQAVTLAPLRRSRFRPMVVSPFVFVLTDAGHAVSTSAEVVATRWVPVADLDHPASRTHRPWRVFGITVPAPAWKLGEDVVWGLTHQMLGRLVRAVRSLR